MHGARIVHTLWGIPQGHVPPKLPHLDPPPQPALLDPPPRPSQNPPLQCPPRKGASGQQLVGGVVGVQKSPPPWYRFSFLCLRTVSKGGQ